MPLELHPLVAPAGRGRFWLGSFGKVPPDFTLAWKVNGADVEAHQVRPLERIASWSSTTSTWAGVFDVPLDEEHVGANQVEVRLSAPNSSDASASFSLPQAKTQVPSALNESFNLLLTSCYFERHDRGVGELVKSQLRGVDSPDVVLAVGDQVYLDNPWWERIPHDADGMAKLFESKYRKNWQSHPNEPFNPGFAGLLTSAPAALIPDDHEYWNNYPHAASFKMSTWWSWAPQRRDDWGVTALDLFKGFQLADPARYEYFFDVEPLSIYMMDNRTSRDADDIATLSAEGHSYFEQWIRHVWDTKKIPVIITGPSLLQPKKGPFKKRVVDRNISNYEDYAYIVDALLEFTRRGRSVLALTGDVHYPRITQAWHTSIDPDRQAWWGRLTEVISSPSALVSRPRPHADTDPSTFYPVPDKRLACTVQYPDPGNKKQRGDHVAMLKFRRTPNGVRFWTDYWMVEKDGLINPKFTAPAVDLYFQEP